MLTSGLEVLELMVHGMEGGGSGLYGGSEGYNSGGGGGSGYVADFLTNKNTVKYGTGSKTTSSVSLTATSSYAKQGNGYARITNKN